MYINEFSHYALFLSLFVAFTYKKKEPPAFSATLAFFCILLSFLGLCFCNLSNNFANLNVFTANAPFLYKISGTWSNHEGSLLLWCLVLSFYGFLFTYRPQSRNVLKRIRESFMRRPFVVLNFLPKVSSMQQLPTSSDAGPLSIRKKRKTLMDAGSSCDSREGAAKQANLVLHLARDEKERASSIDEEHFDVISSYALFFLILQLATSDPFVRNFFVCTEAIAELNPVLQDPILAIHPPCIFAGEVACIVCFGLCSSKIINWIVLLHSPRMQKNLAEKNGMRLCSAGCVGSLNSLFSRSFKHFMGSAPTLFMRSNRTPLMQLQQRFIAPSSLRTGGLAGRGRAGRLVRHGKKDVTFSPFYWAYGTNTAVSDHPREPLRIWIFTIFCFLSVGILLGSWWAYHELGWGGWWFWDPVENASLMPWILATVSIHLRSIPLFIWTVLLQISTLLCCFFGSFSIRSGLLASVHNFVIDDTRLLLWGFQLLICAISIFMFYQMKLGDRTYKKKMIVARSSRVHLTQISPLP